MLCNLLTLQYSCSHAPAGNLIFFKFNQYFYPQHFLRTIVDLQIELNNHCCKNIEHKHYRNAKQFITGAHESPLCKIIVLESDPNTYTVKHTHTTTHPYSLQLREFQAYVGRKKYTAASPHAVASFLQWDVNMKHAETIGGGERGHTCIIQYEGKHTVFTIGGRTCIIIYGGMDALLTVEGMQFTIEGTHTLFTHSGVHMQ
jgi:hypothetical protein